MLLIVFSLLPAELFQFCKIQNCFVFFKGELNLLLYKNLSIKQ